MKRITFINKLLIILFCIFLTACNKHSFDFSQLNYVDANGSWGIPLVNAQYSIGDIISHIDSMNYLEIQPDGNLNLQYEAEFENIIKASDYMHFDGVQYSGVQTVQSVDLPPIPNVDVNLPNEAPLRLPADRLIIEDALIKNGSLTFSLIHNIPITTSVSITCDEITDAAGQALHLDFNSLQNNSFQLNIDLAGYHILPADTNKMDFDLQVSFQTTESPLPATLSIQYAVILSDFEVQEIRGKISTFDLDFSKHINLDVDFGELAGEITLFNPDIVLAVRNSFPVIGHCDIDTLAFTGNNLPPASLISAAPLTVSVPVSPNTYSEQAIDEINHITYNADFDKLNIAGTIVINPDGFAWGSIALTEDATICVRLSVTIPLKIQLNNVTFRDTLDKSPMDTLGLNGISDLTLRIAATNGLPLDMTVQVFFLNSTTGYTKAILTTPLTLMGAYNDIPVQGTPVFATFEDIEVVNRLLACDKIYIEAKLNTQGTVIFNTRQYLKAQVAARFNTNLDDLTDF